MKEQFELLSLAIPLLLSVAALVAESQPQRQQNPQTNQATPSGADKQQVEHGKYLVHHVAMCVKCHSPKEQGAEIVEKQKLTGGTIPIENPFPNEAWALRAPSLVGLPGGWAREEFVHFLQTGEPPTEHQIRLPMPPFRMNEKDAQAVAAYLLSLAE